MCSARRWPLRAGAPARDALRQGGEQGCIQPARAPPAAAAAGDPRPLRTETPAATAAALLHAAAAGDDAPSPRHHRGQPGHRGGVRQRAVQALRPWLPRGANGQPAPPAAAALQVLYILLFVMLKLAAGSQSLNEVCMFCNCIVKVGFILLPWAQVFRGRRVQHLQAVLRVP